MLYTCWSCGQDNDLDDMEDGDSFSCRSFTCGERCVVMGNRTISTDEAYEGACDSQASKRTEEQHYGNDVDDFGPNYPTFHERDDE